MPKGWPSSEKIKEQREDWHTEGYNGSVINNGYSVGFRYKGIVIWLLVVVKTKSRAFKRRRAIICFSNLESKSSEKRAKGITL
jgi:hypothetical protein